MKRILSVSVILLSLINVAFCQNDSLFGVYGGGSMGEPKLILKSDSTFEYWNGFDVGSVSTSGNFIANGDTIFFTYAENIYPEIIEVKSFRDSTINNIRVSIFVVDTNNLIVNDGFYNQFIFHTFSVYQSKNEWNNGDTIQNNDVDTNGIIYLENDFCDSIIIRPYLCSEIIYKRDNKKDNIYEFRIWVPSTATAYYLDEEKLYFKNGLLFFNEGFKGYFWFNENIFKSKKARNTLREKQFILKYDKIINN